MKGSERSDLHNPKRLAVRDEEQQRDEEGERSHA